MRVLLPMFGLLTALTASSFARASVTDPHESLYCTFTEPFISITWTGSTQTLTMTSPEDWNEATGQFEPKDLGRGEFVRVGDPYAFPPSYELRNDQGTPILKLSLNSQGSDGMSDRTYPISAEYLGLALHGGCFTDSAQPWDPNEIEASLGLITP